MTTTFRIARARRASLVLIGLCVCGWPATAAAQSASYSFTVPIAKPVPNPCSGGFELVTGNVVLSISTGPTATDPFGLTANLTSSGQGQDALSDGTLAASGLPPYQYSSNATLEAGFPGVPTDFGQTVTLSDYLVRSNGSTTDRFTMKTTLSLSFTNGVPNAPVLKSLNVACK